MAIAINFNGGDVTVVDPTLFPPPDLIPPFPQPVGPVKSQLEILPGLIVEPRFINGNWYLIPVQQGDHLPDVERMVIEDLADEIRAGELTMGDKCCLINALSKRREVNMDALRSLMGLLATDKPIPLTEIPALAAAQGGDQVLNEMPTALSTGQDKFDLIDYSFTTYQDGVWHTQPRYANIRLGLDWQTFRLGDNIRVWIEDNATGDIVSPVHDLKMHHIRFLAPFGLPTPQWEWRCWPLDSYHFVIPFGSDKFDLLFDGGPYGVDGDNQIKTLESCGNLPDYIWRKEGWSGDDSVGLELGLSYLDEFSRWHPVQNNRYRVVIEHLDRRQYGINLVLNYYNHDADLKTIETRKYSRPYRDQSILQFVLQEEIKVLDDMRVQGLINGIQWAKGKEQLQQLTLTLVDYPIPELPHVQSPPSLPPPVLILPPAPPPIEPPPILIPPDIEFPVFPKRTMTPKDFLEMVFHE